MKLVDMICPRCGGTLKVDMDKQKCKCDFCETELVVDNGTLNIDSYESGYQFEKGRQQAEIDRNNARKNVKLTPAYHREKEEKSNLWLWVLGWIVCWPIPLYILLTRNKNNK